MSDDFEQLLLMPPAAVEVRIRLGLVPDRNHAQVMVEAFDPATKVLLKSWSRPHVPIVGWPKLLDEAIQQTNSYLADLIDPF